MRVWLVSISYDTQRAFLRGLRFLIKAENALESPLHALPEVLQLFSEKGLYSYIVHLKHNDFGRYDVDISFEYAIIRNNQVVVDIYKKIKRLLGFYYEKETLSANGHICYSKFLNVIKAYVAPYGGWTGEAQYQRKIVWDNLAETYHLLSSQKDDTAAYLEKTQYQRRLEPMGLHTCRFDETQFKQEQIFAGGHFFSVAFNYVPQGDTPFHLMLVANEHDFDPMYASEAAFFELEIMLKAVKNLAVLAPGDGNLETYFQWHPSIGMTIPHFHVHILKIPTPEKFGAVFLREIQTVVANARKVPIDENSKRLKLSPEYMRVKGRQWAPVLTQEMQKAGREQYQRFRLFHPQKSLRYKEEQSLSDEQKNISKLNK